MVSPTTIGAQLDALRLTEAVRRRLVDFSADDNYVRDEPLSAICRHLWAGPPEQGGLVSDLWVEGAFPADIAPQTLDSLVKDGLFNADLCAQLDREGAVPRRRPLYMHQAESIDRARELGPDGERPAVVITAGTGAGKTESFLLPILNDLYERHGGGASGVKCLILYPMNALVNDQVDRLYTWLRGQDRLTIFHFTSETPEDKKSADRMGIPNWDACRIRTRRGARGLETRNGQPMDVSQRGRVPDILITNYSMLEYMLCRPQDAVFFGSALRAVVLDEAHLYTGTLAAEITLLLRRVSTRCGVSADDVLQMATSATLGTGNDDELRDFARDIFSKRHAHVVQGRPIRAPMGPTAPPQDPPVAASLANMMWLNEPLIVTDTDAGDAPRLTNDPAMCRRLRAQLPLLVSNNVIAEVEPEEECPAALLHRTLRASPLLQHIESILWEEKRLPLQALTERLWGSDDGVAMRATVILLQLGASARLQVGDYPLLPHRIHLLARPSAGFVVCLNGECSGPAAVKLSPLGSVAATSEDSCQYCASAVVSLCRCRNCGEWVLAARLDGNRLRPAVTSERDTGALRFLTLRMEETQPVITLNPVTGDRSGAGSAGVRVTPITHCPQCGRETSEGESFAGPFSTGGPLTLAILAETVLAELPPYPSQHNQWLPGRGRRMLAFSDSRQEAARLGPRLTRQHETQLIRAAIVRLLSEQPVADADVIASLQTDIEDLKGQLAGGVLSGPMRQFKEKTLRERQRALESYTVGGSIGDWSTNLSAQLLLSQVLDPQHGAKHYAHGHPSNGMRAWSQKEWDANWTQVRQQSQSFLAREFASPVRRAISAETLGLVEVTYPGLDRLEAPGDVIGRLPSVEMRERLVTCWSAFMHGLCDTLRGDGAITLGEDQEDRAYQFGSVYLGKWVSEQHTGPGLERFVGTTMKQRRRLFAAAVLSACGLASEAMDQWSKDILNAAFRQLRDNAPLLGQPVQPTALTWLQRTDRQTQQGAPADAIRLVFPHLGLRHPLELYRCARTGHVWVRSVLGCAPEQGCNGTLQRVDEGDLDGDPRLARQRREYRESPVFQMGLWAEEHSAQLSPQENRRLQDLFKAGIRNILSATTTLELGIDIGGLNAVLMGNVPPGKANYLQRAGRAGRRADGSSIVVTYARPRPFDNEVFQRFGEYLERPLHRPLVLLNRARVVCRHFHSYLLGEFFRSVYPPTAIVGAMQAFGTMGGFCGVARPPYWKNNEARPSVEQPEVQAHVPPATRQWWNPGLRAPGLEAQFLQYLFWVRDWNEERVRPDAERLLSETIVEAELGDWDQLLERVSDDFASAIENWRKDYDYLLSAWYGADQKAQANAIRYQLTALYDITLIEGLADHQFLPHYGFPIGVHKLRVIAPDSDHPGRVRDEDQYRLERGSLLALREYVPGSQLLVGGKQVTSHGLLKHWSGGQPRHIHRAAGSVLHMPQRTLLLLDGRRARWLPHLW